MPSEHLTHGMLHVVVIFLSHPAAGSECAVYSLSRLIPSPPLGLMACAANVSLSEYDHLPDVATAYRHFRIYQTGKNSSNTDRLMCTGIELYGVLLSAGAE